MANGTQVKQLLELAEDCTKTTADQLITNADWGTINFEGCCCKIIMLFERVLRAVAEKWRWTTF